MHANYKKLLKFTNKIADIKNHEFFPHDLICDEFVKCDLTDPLMVSNVIFEDCDELCTEILNENPYDQVK